MSLTDTADKLFAMMGITAPGEHALPKVDYVPRPRDIDRSAYTEQELRWMAEAQEEPS